MLNRNTATCLCLSFVWLVSAGCASSGGGTGTDYQTVGDLPGRDTELAKRHHAIALELIAEGKSDEAEAELKKALSADITFGPAHNNLGKLYYNRGELYQAAWEFQYAAKLLPYQPEPRNNLGLVLEDAGRLDEAVNHYREALKLEPDNPQLIGNLARSKHRRGDQDDEQHDLLQQLVLKDTRPEWVAWAREQLALRSQ